MTCPDNVTRRADDGENSAEVTWPVPTAIDNSGFLPTLTVIPALVPPVRLPVGDTVITYVAEDNNRNKQKCRFTVAVKGKIL